MKTIRTLLDGVVQCKNCDETILCEHCNDTGIVQCTCCNKNPARIQDVVVKHKLVKPRVSLLCYDCA